MFLKTKRHAVQEAINHLIQKNALDAKEQLIRIVEKFVEEAFPAVPSAQGLVERLKADLDRNRLWYEDGLLYLLVRIYMGEIKPFQNVKILKL